jgi:hypothetical protein
MAGIFGTLPDYLWVSGTRKNRESTPGSRIAMKEKDLLANDGR